MSVNCTIYDASSKLPKRKISPATGSGSALLKGTSKSVAHRAVAVSRRGSTSSVASSNRSTFSALSATDRQEFLFAERVEGTDSFILSQGEEAKMAFHKMALMRNFNSRA